MDDLPSLEHERTATDVCLREERAKTDTELARRASQRELETFAAALLLGTERKKTDEKLGHERKRTDELFREQGKKHRVLHTASESTLRLFIESVQDYALFLLDPAGHVVSWNAGAHAWASSRASARSRAT